jgi:AcrR family transcriptional regulator
MITGVRVYRSPRREEQARRTRARVIEAAREHFLAAGYTTTTMRGIASAAGVSVQTVELAFGTKRALFKAVLDVTIAGDDRPIPVLQREQARAAESTTGVESFLDLVGQLVRTVSERVAGILAVLAEASRVDDDMAALGRELDAQRAATAGWIVRGIAERAELRDHVSHEHAVDTVWLLMDPFVFRRLTGDRGWTADQFQRWFTDGIRQLLVTPAPG